MSEPAPEPAPTPAAPDTPGATPAVPDLPAPDEAETDEAIDDERGTENAGGGNHIEEFVKSLPPGFAICPTCLAVGAVMEDPPFDPNTMVCPDCKGHTKTRTGALTGRDVERDCARCQARGWIPRDGVTPPASPARAVDLQGETAPRDVNGRTPDDPDFDWANVVRDVEPIQLESAPVS